jgi:hypothetical protein
MSNQITCVSCGQMIQAEDVNLSTSMAKCRNCNAVFSFLSPSATGADDSFQGMFQNLLKARLAQQEPGTIHRPSDGRSVTMPSGVWVERHLGELRFTIPWRNTRRWGFFLVFAIFWNAIVIPFVIMGVVTGEWMILLFTSLHLMVGLSILYYTLGLMLNKTEIVVSNLGVDIKHGPIPMPYNPNRFMPRRDIEQLFVEEYVPSRTNGRPDFTYAVTALITSAERQRLVGGFTQPGHALYLEQEIENFLNIEDRPMS